MIWKRPPSDPPPLREPAAEPPLPRDEFHALVERAERDPSSGARSSFAFHVREHFFALPTWFVLADAGLPSVRSRPPLVVVGCGHLRCGCVFSSFERARASAARLGLDQGPRNCGALALPIDHACDLLCGDAAVDGVVFNPDRPAWTVAMPSGELAADFESHFDRLTPRMFGRFGEAVNRGGRSLRSRLIRRLLAADEWWFVATRTRPNAPALIATSNGSLTVPIYTDAERARRGGPHAVAPLNEGVAVPMPTTPRDGVSYLRRLHERIRDEVVAAIVNHVPDEPGEPAPLPITELLAAAEAKGW